MKKKEDKRKRHYFFPELAKLYGVDEAIMLNHFIYWISNNSMNGNNYQKGRFWTFNPVKKFTEYFPYWSESQIARIIKSLIKQGVLIDGNYNRHLYDRTKWYALNDQDHFLTRYNPFDEFEECKKLY